MIICFLGLHCMFPQVSYSPQTRNDAMNNTNILPLLSLVLLCIATGEKCLEVLVKVKFR